MRTITLLTALWLLLPGCSAQLKQAQTTTVRIDGDCPMCEKTIEKAAYVKGEAEADWDVDAKTARITFDNAEVDADHVLGEVDQGGALLENLLDIGRGTVASEMVGLSEEVFGRTVTYLKERKQFGKLIGEFQALQHRAAQLYIDIEISRAAVLKALQALDADIDKAEAAVAVAKVHQRRAAEHDVDLADLGRESFAGA